MIQYESRIIKKKICVWRKQCCKWWINMNKRIRAIHLHENNWKIYRNKIFLQWLIESCISLSTLSEICFYVHVIYTITLRSQRRSGKYGIKSVRFLVYTECAFKLHNFVCRVSATLKREGAGLWIVRPFPFIHSPTNTRRDGRRRKTTGDNYVWAPRRRRGKETEFNVFLKHFG